MTRGRSAAYSLLEVIVAVFVLSGIVMSAFSVFEIGARQSLKIEHKMVAARLAQKIAEELHSKNSQEITTISPASFPYPFQNYQYLYSVQPAVYSGLSYLQQINVIVKGPLLPSGENSVQTTNASLSMLLARQVYSP